MLLDVGFASLCPLQLTAGWPGGGSERARCWMGSLLPVGRPLLESSPYAVPAPGPCSAPGRGPAPDLRASIPISVPIRPAPWLPGGPSSRTGMTILPSRLKLSGTCRLQVRVIRVIRLEGARDETEKPAPRRAGTSRPPRPRTKRHSRARIISAWPDGRAGPARQAAPRTPTVGPTGRAGAALRPGPVTPCLGARGPASAPNKNCAILRRDP